METAEVIGEEALSFVVETAEVIGEEALSSLRELSRRISTVTGDQES